MANPYSDVRAITARLGQVQPRGTTPSLGLNPSLPTRSRESIQLGRAANKFAIQNPELRAQIESIASGSSSQKPAGVMGTILGNPVTKVALKGLEAFAVPGRAIVSGARELADVVDGNANTKASFGDFAKQVKDSQFGFGKAFKINTGSIWIDRAIGFVGDVALDPLTYATFGASAGLKGVQGSAKAAGYANRTKLAQVVLRDTGDAALAKSVAIQGRKALFNRPDVLERIGANKSGVYFFGKRVKVGKDGMGLRVPFSGTIGEIGESTIARTRLAITDTKLGQKLQRLTMPKDFLDMRLKLARNQLSPDDAADALKLFDIIPKQRAARAVALQAMDQELMAVLRSQEADLPSYRNSVYRLLEDPTQLATATPVEQRAYAVWKDYLDKRWDDVSSRWMEADEAAEIGRVENYVPRVSTDDAKKFLNSSNPYADDVRAIYQEDPFALPDAFTPRSLRAGKKWFGVVLEDKDLNIDSLNRIAREEGKIDFDFFETDIAEIMRRYSADTADEIGIIERNKALRDTGFFKRIEDQRVQSLDVDEDAVASARTFLDEQTNILDSVEQGFRRSVTDLVEGVRAESTRVANNLATGARLAEDMGKYLYDMLDDVARKIEAVEQAKNRLSSLWGPSADIPVYSLTDDFPVMLRPVLGQYDSMMNDLLEYSSILETLQQQAVKEGYDVLQVEDALRQIEESAAEAQRKMQDSIESIKSAMEVSNELERVWDSIVDGVGKRVEGADAASVVNKVRDILGVKGTSNARKTAKARTEAMGLKGSLKDFLRGKPREGATPEELAALKFFEDVFAQANESGLAGVSRSRVSDMTEPQFLNIVFNTASKDINISDLRAASLYAIGRDIRLSNASSVDELPEFSKNMYEELTAVLKAADLEEASRIAVGRASKKAREGEAALNARLGVEYDDALNMRSTMEEYRSVSMLITNHLEQQFGPDWFDVKFDEGIVGALEIAGSLSGGVSRNLPWLYEYIDNAGVMLGKSDGEDILLGDVYDDVSKKYAQMKDTFENKTVIIDDARSANLLEGKNVAVKASKTRQQIINDFEAEMRRIRDIKTKESEVFRYRQYEYRRDKASSTVRNDIADRLVKYQAVSDAVQKFQAIAGVLAPHGLIPSEDMWRGVLRTVSHQYGGQFSTRVRRLHLAEEKFTDFYAAFTKSLHEMKSLPADEQIAVGVLFKEAMANAVAGPDGEVLRELVGSSMVNLVDVADMRLDIATLESAVRSAVSPAQKAAAKQRLDDFVDTYVIPWAKSQDPDIRANKGPAVGLLKERAKGDIATSTRVNKKALSSVRGPLSRNATESDVYRWFNSMLRTVDSTTGEVLSEGTIRSSISNYTASEIFFRRMSDGYLDVDGFFKTLDGSRNTPSSYAVQLNEWAKTIEGSTIISESNPFIRGSVLGEVGTEYREAYKKGPKVAEKAQKEAANVAEAARRAREVSDAFSNPNLTQDQLKALGFTREMVVSRESVLEHKRLMGTAQYANALKDQDIVNFLNVVSDINLAAFQDGFIVGSRRTPKYADDAITMSPEAVAEKVSKLQAQLVQVDEAERLSRRSVRAPFVHQRGDKLMFKSGEAKKAWQMRDEAWVRTEKRKFDFQRTQIQSKIDEAESTVGQATEGLNVPVEFEVTPVFATMPDGSVIKFTEAEYASLYSEPIPGLGVVALNKERTGLVRQINEFRKALKIASERPGATWNPAKKGAVRKIENDIVKAQSRIKDIDFELLRSFKDTRNSALEKVRLLVQGSAGDGSDAIKMNEWENVLEQMKARSSLSIGSTQGRLQFAAGDGVISSTGSADVLVYGPRGAQRQVNPTLSQYFVNARKANPELQQLPNTLVSSAGEANKAVLRTMWEKHPSYAVLAKADELAQSAALSVYESSTKNAQMLRRAADEAMKVADRTQTAVDEIQISFRKAVEEMRNSELQAAKAAGAEFDTKTPFWSTGKEVTYTINGKSYVVPSVQDMLADPMRYVKQSRKRGDIFFDIKKPGNVALWTSASNEVKASVALFSLQSIVLKDKAGLFEAGILNPSIARANEAYNVMSQWSEDLAGLAEKIRNVREVLDVERAGASADVVAAQADATASKLDAFELASELRSTIDGFMPSVELTPDGLMQLETKVASLTKRSELLESIVRNMPSKSDTAALGSSKKASTRAKWMQVHLDAINANRELLRKLATEELMVVGGGPSAVVWNSLLDASAAETRFILQQSTVDAARSSLDRAQAGAYVDKVLKPASEAFQKTANDMLKTQGRQVAGDFNMPSFSVSSELNKIMQNVNRITDAATVRELSRFMGAYTGFFKAYATLSPGFHVRNSISNTFQLFAAGADVKNMREGLQLWRSLGEHFKAGGNFDSWLETVPESLRVKAKIAGEVTLGLGGGKTDDAFAEFVDLNKNLLTDNAATRASRKFGQKIEGSARFMLAYDSAVNGLDFTESFNRTRRFLVDYNDPTILDDTVRNIIPFWTWMSRNLPVQVVTQWTNPKPYVLYQRFANNFRVEDDENLPPYLREQNPIKLGDSTYLALDLPFMSTQRTIEDVSDPRKLLSMVNPGLRVPVELAGGRQFYTGREFDENNPAGKYAATNLLPMLGQLERITRTGERSDNLGLARYLGAPVRGVPEASQNAEMARRLYELQNLVNKNKEQ